ncbi:DUF2510 domain-containing protein [Salinibacterium sp. SYSU T00001]|uniref:DUF2510 domain-containing protein n=1 Tax=Homoserinimonas sedimenticola TaxID=2986805 RepID=UPI002235975A|nr:DUF2510 domain-containing protein [Salinibacterium sedimenticola]MCW4386263.1 DUF2510 domain-containing protein [Salinibacterium sedimenticola]
MTDSSNNAAPAGWYVDPMTRQHLRWWNGQAWTESVAPLPGSAAPAAAAPAPRVQQRFALGAADESTQAAAAQTQAAAERFAPAAQHNGESLHTGQQQTAARQPASQQTTAQPASGVAAQATPQPFVTQVPAYAARTEPARTEAEVDAQPAIPWPAMGAGAPAASHYTPQYGDALDLLKGTSLVSGSGGADATPGYRRTSSAPAAAASGFAPSDYPGQTATDAATSTTPHRQQPPHAEVHPDLAFATRQQQEDAARAADEAHRAELARQEAARLEWDRQFQAQQALAEEQRLAELQQAQAHAAQATTPGAAPTAVTTDNELESTLMSRRQRREKAENQAPAPAPAPFEASDDKDDDIWAGHGERRADVAPQWSTVGRARAAERQQLTPRHWGTISVWLLTVTPWLGALAAFVALALFDAWSLPALGVLALPWLVGVLWAQQDSTRLSDYGHHRPARAAWAMLTAPVYLIVRTLRVRREVGAGWAPLIGWFANAAVVVAIVLAVGLAPDALPAYVVTALEPLRETAAAWVGN